MFYPLVYLTKGNLPAFSVSSRYSFCSHYNTLATRLDCNFPSQSKFDRSSRVSKNPVTGTFSGPASIAQASSLPLSNNKNSQQQQQHDLSNSPADLEPILPANLVAENNHQKTTPSTSNSLSRRQSKQEQNSSPEKSQLQQFALAVTTSTTSVLPRLSLVKRLSNSKRSSSSLMEPNLLEAESVTTLTEITESTTPTSPPPPLPPPMPEVLPSKPSQLIPLPTGPFRLHINLKQGRNLAIKDSCGTSDPYVKFKIGNTAVYRSKTIYRDLNPLWDEEFDIFIDDLTTPLNVRVFDYDWGMTDDFLGAAALDLTQLTLNRPCHFSLELFSDENAGCQGIIDLSATLYLKPVENEGENSKTNSLRNNSYEQARKLKVQIWSSVVNIVIIEGKNLSDKDGELLSKPHLRLRLGNEKYKTKTATRIASSSTITWLEQFDFHLFEDQPNIASHLLEINLFEKTSLGREDSVARAVLDLTNVEGERTHSMTCDFEHGGSGTLSLLVTISGSTASETISDLSTQITSDQTKEIESTRKRYGILRTLHNIRDVGHLSIKVFRATGLASADIGGKSDPFCVLQLVNSRLQTQTEYKTLNPTWNKIFTFNVKDINSVLEVTVYDEDRDHRFEFLGTVSIPLLRIQNGLRKWYVLKDRKLRARAKGSNPQILLELNIIWNELRASIQTLQPKENKYIEPETKFSRQTFVRNVMRIKSFVMEGIEIGKYIESCWEWESTIRSCIAFFLFLVLAWFVELWMIPWMLLVPFIRSYLVRSFTNPNIHDYDSDGTGDDDDDEVDEKNKEERKSLKEKLQAIQEATMTVQNAVGYIASFFESIKNTFNYTVPFLSYLAIVLLVIGSFVLYAIPLRYLILAWGINKFTRKILRPHSIPNNELLDFLSRVPNDEQLVDFRELRSEPGTEHGDKSSRRVPKRK